jgi:pilus assembly protein CpaF
MDSSTTSNRLATASPRVGYKSQILSQIMDTLGSIRQVFDDPDVNEIMINAPNEVFIAKNGRNVRFPVNLSRGEIEAAITLIAALVTKEVGEKSRSRILSARLPGFRVEAILPPVAVNGPSMCIRRHAARVFSLEEYVSQGVITQEYAQILVDGVAKRETFLVVGGTASGKTTFLNTALSLIPKEERLFVIESVQELQIRAENHVLVECDEEHGVTPRKAVRTAMRYAPGRIFMGELRGPEAYDWADAANTGHPGGGATIHANSATRSLPRLENLMLMANMGIPYEPLRALIAETVQLVFYIQREGKVRTVSQVSRLHGYNRASGEYEIETF